MLLLFMSCDIHVPLNDLQEIPYPVPKNWANEDQFNAVQGDVLRGNILRNDRIIQPFRVKESNIQTNRGFTFSVDPNGFFTFAPPTDFVGKDTFSYSLLTVNEHGEWKAESKAKVFLSIIDVRRTGHFVDFRDGRNYGTILLEDGLVWMSENLSFALEGSTVYENNGANEAIYGRLYSWRLARQACPEGWHLPSQAKVKTLFEKHLIGPPPYNHGLDDNYNAYFEGGYNGWNLMAGGWRDHGGNYMGISNEGRYWTSSPSEDPSEAYYFEVSTDGSNLMPQDTTHYYACRCVKNSD